MSAFPMISAVSRVIEAPDLWATRLPPEFSELCPRIVDADGYLEWRVGDARAIEDFSDAGPRDRASMEALATPAGRMEIQQRDQTAGEVLYSFSSVWPLIYATENDAFIRACTRSYNEWLAEFCAAAPDSLIGVAKIPITGADDATAELAHAHALGLRGAMLDAWPAGADCPPAVGECDSFWEAAASLRMPISLHRPLGGEEEPPYAVAAGVAPEFYGDMTAIIYANIPDRYPEIKFVSVTPNAGWAPAQFEALNESYMRTAALRKVNLGDPDLYPSDYLRRYFFFATQEDRVALVNRAYFGEPHLLWGSFSFVPFVSEWPKTGELFRAMTDGLPETFRRMLAAENVARLYGLAGAEPFSPAELNRYDSYALL